MQTVNSHPGSKPSHDDICMLVLRLVYQKISIENRSGSGDTFMFFLDFFFPAEIFHVADGYMGGGKRIACSKPFQEILNQF